MKVHMFVFIAVILVLVFSGGVFAVTNTALQFDGSNDFAIVPDSDTLSPQITGAVTLSAWVKVSSLPTTQPGTILAKGTDYYWEYALALQPSPNSAQVILWRPTGSAYAHIEAGILTLNQWHNITSTYNGTALKLYVDGSLVGQVSSFNSPLGGNGIGKLFFGKEDSSAHTWNFMGAMDEVSIWNVAMTDAQVQQLVTTPLSGNETGLVAYWNFNEGSGQVLTDLTGHGHNGILGSGNGDDSSDPVWVNSDGSVTPEPNEPIAYWNFDEGAGNIAADSCGFNDATIFSPVWGPAVFGNALTFTGSAYASVTDMAKLQIKTNQITASAWVNLAADVGRTQQRIICKQQSPPVAWGLEIFGAGYGGGTTGNQVVFHDSSGTTYYNCSGKTHLEPGKWYHVVATDNAGKIRIYVNGKLDGSSDGGYGILPTINAPVAIGRAWPDNAFYFKGQIDEVCLYGKALSATEVQQLYHSYINAAPTADAGADQTVYAGIYGMAEATLDGSGSSDPENDELAYTWSYTIDGQVYEANGVNPTLTIPAGTHTITLVVDDGEYDSEADDVVVEVVAPLKVDMKLSPVLHWQPWKFVTAQFKFPQHLDEQIDPYSIALAADPNVKADYFTLNVYRDSILRCNAGFSSISVTSVKPNTIIKIFGSFRSGRLFFGEDVVNAVKSLKPEKQ